MSVLRHEDVQLELEVQQRGVELLLELLRVSAESVVQAVEASAREELTTVLNRVLATFVNDDELCDSARAVERIVTAAARILEATLDFEAIAACMLEEYTAASVLAVGCERIAGALELVLRASTQQIREGRR